jgi:hypothetical protein
MNLNDLANLGQIIGAVVVSLIYVALQIRQNTNASDESTDCADSRRFVLLQPQYFGSD